MTVMTDHMDEQIPLSRFHLPDMYVHLFISPQRVSAGARRCGTGGAACDLRPETVESP